MSSSDFAILFDWDGVVVDSSAPHERAWERFAHQEGLTLPKNHFEKSFGMKNRTIIMDLFKWTDDPAEADAMGDIKEAMFRDTVNIEGMSALPGVGALLDDLKSNHVACVVGSSAPLANILCVLDRLGFREHFRAILSAENVTQGKPHPEVFLKAAEAAGLPPSQCLVIEDAVVGVEAALAAGAAVLAVTTTREAADLHMAHRVAASLESLRTTDLESLVRTRR